MHPYVAARVAEIRAQPAPVRRPIQVLNSRFHYARTKHRGAFDLWWHPRTGEIHLRVLVGRRVLPVPAGAERIGRYDRTSLWADVKADFLYLVGNER